MPAREDVKPGAPGGRTEPFVGQKGSAVPNGTRKEAVYQVSTGQAFEVWPVDARELVASGEYVRERPSSQPAISSAEPESLPAPAAPLAEAPPAEVAPVEVAPARRPKHR